MKHKGITTELPLSLHSEYAAYDVDVIEVNLGFNQEAFVELCIEVRTTVALLRNLERHGDFHNTPDVRLPAAIEGFVAERPIFIEMRFEPKLLAQLPSTPDAVADMLQSAANTFPVLFEASSWYVLNVKQAHGPVMTGYATTWFLNES